MNELKVFSNSEFGELGVMLIDGREYFPAIQCAKILGYSNPRKAILDHCKEEGVTKRDGVSYTTNQYGVTSQQITQIKYISEGNLYRLIVSSKLPKAAEFEHWVFDEVLPQIRHNGGYVGNVEELIARTATAVISEVMKQILPLVTSHSIKTVTEIDMSEYKYKGQTKSIIEMLDDDLRAKVDEMIKSGVYSHQGIADFLRDNGVSISQASVSNYARRHCGVSRQCRTVSLQISLDDIKED